MRYFDFVAAVTSLRWIGLMLLEGSNTLLIFWKHFELQTTPKYFQNSSGMVVVLGYFQGLKWSIMDLKELGKSQIVILLYDVQWSYPVFYFENSRSFISIAAGWLVGWFIGLKVNCQNYLVGNMVEWKLSSRFSQTQGGTIASALH